MSQVAAISVAPRAGAWVETPDRADALMLAFASHPVRVRGLKHWLVTPRNWGGMSHPVRVRGLKPGLLDEPVRNMLSHPVRVRGLKLCPGQVCLHTPLGRTPCGCVG